MHSHSPTGLNQELARPKALLSLTFCLYWLCGGCVRGWFLFFLRVCMCLFACTGVRCACVGGKLAALTLCRWMQGLLWSELLDCWRWRCTHISHILQNPHNKRMWYVVRSLGANAALSDINIIFFSVALFLGQKLWSRGNGAAEMTCSTLLSSRDHPPIKEVEQNLVRTWLAGPHDGQVMESSIIFLQQWLGLPALPLRDKCVPAVQGLLFLCHGDISSTAIWGRATVRPSHFFLQ